MLYDALGLVGFMMVLLLYALRKRKPVPSPADWSPPDCFACRPYASPGTEVRALCGHHKNTCVLADGAPLYATLAQAEPPNSQLEGSLLGWLYNPVFVVDSAGHRRRAWTVFAAGGMAVFEDRFEAKDVFEFWMRWCERPDMVRLLKLVSRLAHAPEDFQAAFKRSLRPEILWAYHLWEMERRIDERRKALGRWPKSFEELTQILYLPPSRPGARKLSPEEEDDFLAILTPIATKRLTSSRISG